MRLFVPVTSAALGWGALAFGAEYPWAYAPLLVLCATIGLVALLVPSPRRAPLPRALVFTLGGIVAAAILYLIPLPEPVVTAVSPNRFAHDFQQLYSATVDLQSLDTAGSDAATATLSVLPSRTALGLVFLVVFAVFFLGCVRAIGIKGAEGIARGVLVVGLVVALMGVIQSATPLSGTVLGWWYPRKDAPPFAPFINENHFAGWMVMSLPLAIGYALGGVIRGVRFVPADWRNRVLWATSREGGEYLLAGLVIVMMACSVVLSRSRSGVACLILVLVLFAAWMIRRQQVGVGRLAPIYLGLVLAAALTFGRLDALALEFAATPLSMEGRVSIWRGTLRVIQDFPLVGTGLNTYGIAMLGYQDAMPEATWVEAHNDYLQLAAEGGLLLTLPAVAFLFLFVREVRRRFCEAVDGTKAYWLRVGAVVGLVGVACQELVDFSLQMPGNAALFVVLSAIAVHPGRRRSRRHSPRGNTRTWARPTR